MVRELVHDPILLARKSLPATEADLPIARDLLDTLLFHREGCVGMAANMIGQFVNIIAFDCEGSYMVMFNPEILRRDKEYETQEGCLSLLGGPRKTAFFRFIFSGLLQNHRIEHDHVCSLIVKGDDPLTHTDHIGRHAHAGLLVGSKSIPKVLNGLQIFLRCCL